jgi:hypothetical protein
MEHVRDVANKKAHMKRLIEGITEIEKEESSESASDALEIEEESSSKSGLEVLDTALAFKRVGRVRRRELLMN